MHYVVLDLEWNTAYSKAKRGFVNEIIEFGAVKLDEQFHVLDGFSAFCKPQISPKLNSHVKKLTSIRNEDLADALPYQTVYQAFADWSLDGEPSVPVFLSWGDMDIRTLIANNQYFFHDPHIKFMEEYVDLQIYFMHQNGLPKSKLIGLSDAAELIHEDPDQFIHHRALDDSKLAAVCLRAVYEPESFEDSVALCDEELYKRILFKPYYINNIQDKQIDQSMLSCSCFNCGGTCKPLSEWKCSNNGFHAIYECPDCSTRYRVNISFKRTYNQVITKKNVIVLKPKKKKARAKAGKH